MKRLILFLTVLLILCPVVEAALGSKGLIVNGGETVVVQKGFKKWVPVRDGFSGLPVVKGLTFYSENPLIFTVDRHSGVVRGNQPGTATLTVVNQKGDCGTVSVQVRRGKVSLWWLLLLLPLLLLLIKRGHRR